MKSEPDKLLARHAELVHSDNQKVESHVQQQSGDWIIHTLMIADCDVPFRYKRPKEYRSLAGARVNLTYYPSTHTVAGMEFEVMNVVRIRRT